jgi:putative ABC transport system permease protein
MKFNQILRSFLRDRLATIIIIISLAVGLMCITLIILFINRELKTDKFQSNVDRIYLLKGDNPFVKGSKMYVCRLGGAEYMKENFAQVEDYCRIQNIVIQKTEVNGQIYFDNPVLYEASANFFSFFTYKLLTNNPNTVFEACGDIAISEDLAVKYFGTSSVVGKIISLTIADTKKDYAIKGVFTKPKDNTQLSFDLVTFAKESESFAFLKLKERSDPSELEKLFAANEEKIPNINAGTPGRYYLESFRKSYFDTTPRTILGPTRDKSDLWIAFIIGIMILTVATFNYLGLVNNKLLDKTMELYIRRLNGGSKVILVSNILAEITITIFIALILGLVLLNWAIPFFNEFSNSNIQFHHFFQIDGLLIIALVIIFLLLITLIFAYFKIDFHTVSRILIDHKGKVIQVPVFNIIQLTVSFVLLICSTIIIKQIHYINNKNIGLDKDVLEVKLPDQYSEKAAVFKEELLRNPLVNQVSIASASPLQDHWSSLLEYTKDGEKLQYTPSIFKGDENYISTLGIKLVNGRNFSGNKSSDKNNCIINESLARNFPYQNLVGSKLPGDSRFTIIGITKDFNFSSLKNIVEPCYITFNTGGSHILVKASADRLPIIRKSINEISQRIIPDYPISIDSVKERFEWFHRENSNYIKLIGTCCLISLFLSMIGLFAISFSSSRKRSKEIGLRKINGASISAILFLLNKDFLKWVVISFVIATPISVYCMHNWLKNYAYKTNQSWWVFAISIAVVMTVAILTVSFQSWKAATKNPVDSLRFE